MKNRFTIEGSNALLKAFIAELKIEYRGNNEYNNWNGNSFKYIGPSENTNHDKDHVGIGRFTGFGKRLPTHFVLPEQWHEAVSHTIKFFESMDCITKEFTAMYNRKKITLEVTRNLNNDYINIKCLELPHSSTFGKVYGHEINAILATRQKLTFGDNFKLNNSGDMIMFITEVQDRSIPLWINVADVVEMSNLCKIDINNQNL